MAAIGGFAGASMDRELAAHMAHYPRKPWTPRLHRHTPGECSAFDPDTLVWRWLPGLDVRDRKVPVRDLVEGDRFDEGNLGWVVERIDRLTNGRIHIEMSRW